MVYDAMSLVVPAPARRTTRRSYANKGGQFWTPIGGHFSTPIDSLTRKNYLIVRFWPGLIVSTGLLACPLLGPFLPRALHNGISAIDTLPSFAGIEILG